MRHTRQTAGVFLAAFVLVIAGIAQIDACPFCKAPSQTLSERLAQSDAALLAQWVDGEKGKDGRGTRTTLEVVQAIKKPDDVPGKEERITLGQYRDGKTGDLFLLLGTRTKGAIRWDKPLEVTETSFQYIVQAPSPEAPTQKRLTYFLKFLEYPDQQIADDAYAEFAAAPYEDIAPLAEKFPRQKLRRWITDPETPVTRLALYGMMLGLCGERADAEVLKEIVHEPTEDYRVGINGIMSGYLLLTGERGLEFLEKTKIDNRDAPFSETYAAMQALRFTWTYAEGRIPKDRLRASMRKLLDRPELADLVIADLARWRDWSVQDRLMKLYDKEGYDVPPVRRAIARYMLASMKDVPERTDGEDGKVPEHVKKGRKYIKALEEKDPKNVRRAKRFF